MFNFPSKLNSSLSSGFFVERPRQVLLRCWPIVSADYRPTLSVECWSSIGRDIGRVSAEMSADSVSRLSVKYRPTLSVEGWSSIGRDIERHTPPTYSTDIWADTRPILDRHLGRHLGEISTDTWSSVGRNSLQGGRPSVANIGRYLVGMLVYTWSTPRPTYSTDISADTRPSVGRYLARESAEMSVEYRPTLSVDYQPRYRLSVGR